METVPPHQLRFLLLVLLLLLLRGLLGSPTNAAFSPVEPRPAFAFFLGLGKGSRIFVCGARLELYTYTIE